MPEISWFAKLYLMTDNMTDLIELLLESRDTEPDSDLEDGQVYAPDGSIVTL
jgi:hypothetical protein